MYSGDFSAPGMLHAVLVQSAVACGSIASIETQQAEHAAGVAAVYTRGTLPPLQPPPPDFTADFPSERRAPFADDAIHYAGQHVALLLAETLEQAQAAARLIRVHYATEKPLLEMRFGAPGSFRPDHFATNAEEKLQSSRGVAGQSDHTLEAVYRTPVLHHNPMELSATLAIWSGDTLTLHDSTRWLLGCRKIVAHMLSMPETNVRVLCPNVGGAFGSKAFLWQHVALAAQAARTRQRPVKLVLTRQQMFTSVGHRPRTEQRLSLSAGADGRLSSVRHITMSETSPVAHFTEPAGMTSRNLYRTPQATISHEVVPTNLATPCFMRAPGESPGMFALESAMDELAEKARMDPLEFRLRNDAERDFDEDRPWSSRHLRECYHMGAQRFGWSKRAGAPRSMQRGRKLVGGGMATAAYPGRRSPATVRATLGRDGVAVFSAATHEIGGGTATAMERIAAEVLGLPPEKVRFVLGDSAEPQAPVAGASQTTASVGPAVAEAGRQLRAALLQAAADPQSALHGSAPELLDVRQDILVSTKDTNCKDAISGVLARMPQAQLTAEASANLDDEAKHRLTFHSFGAHFAEVEVDQDLCEVRVTRWVSVMDVGRVVNARTARSQVIGGITFGIGMALMERTLYDPRSGAPFNNNLADYLVPTCCDVPEFDIAFLDFPDTAFNPLGVRGLGEIGITGVPAAVANAVYHATGVRVRTLPITLESLMAG